MCLAIVALQALDEWPLIIVANRDEFHARPTLAAQPWPENSHVLAGKDLAAGGSWFGVTQAGQIALLTNYREPLVTQQTSTTRGTLVSNYLILKQKPLLYLQNLKTHAHLYNGFNLLVGDGSGLYVASNRLPLESTTQHEPNMSQNNFINPISAGVWGLSNAFWNTPWPKLTLMRDQVGQYLKYCKRQLQAPNASAFVHIMQNIEPVAESLLPRTGLSLEREKQLATPFIVGNDYGTRCTTVLMQHRDGRIFFHEKSYAAGSLAAKQTVSWQFLPKQPELGWQTVAN
jgi:uncharacterized protein with NRDE domain